MSIYYGRYTLILLKYAIHILTYLSHNTIKDEYFEVSNHSLVRGNKGTEGVNDKNYRNYDMRLNPTHMIQKYCSEGLVRLKEFLSDLNHMLIFFEEE